MSGSNPDGMDGDFFGAGSNPDGMDGEAFALSREAGDELIEGFDIGHLIYQGFVPGVGAV